MNIKDMLPYRFPKTSGKRLVDPHVIILGAGASVASCKFDKNGRQAPLLRNIHTILGLTAVLKEYWNTCYA